MHSSDLDDLIHILDRDPWIVRPTLEAEDYWNIDHDINLGYLIHVQIHRHQNLSHYHDLPWWYPVSCSKYVSLQFDPVCEFYRVETKGRKRENHSKKPGGKRHRVGSPGSTSRCDPFWVIRTEKVRVWAGRRPATRDPVWVRLVLEISGWSGWSGWADGRLPTDQLKPLFCDS
jgi:hypothetical protein